MTTTDKKITLTLVGLDGNAFSLMGAFAHQARREGWTKEEIELVMNDATSGDYNHLLRVLMDHCEDSDDDSGGYDDDEEDDFYEHEDDIYEDEDEDDDR